jgi:RimJ/RimL family protein N-acetyltransferase
MAAALGVCGLDDAGALMTFVRDEWSARHILANSRALLDWQHRDEAARRYTFVLARGDAGEIVGMLGFIPASRYDPALSGAGDTLWLTTWKVRADRAKGLGLSLLRELSAREPAGWIGTVGLNPATRPIYEALGYRTGKLARHYLLNPEIEFRLARVPPASSPPKLSSGTTLTPIGPSDFLQATDGLGLDDADQIPRKTRAFLYRRYLKHPFYRYDAFLARDGDHHGVVVVRACSHGGAEALRVVDYLGSPIALARSGRAFDLLLAEYGAEYVDFYCSGLAEELAAAGFRVVDADGELVLPGYFEPFVVRNVDLLFAIKGPPGRLVICKGDADQDRPSQLDR